MGHPCATTPVAVIAQEIHDVRVCVVADAVEPLQRRVRPDSDSDVLGLKNRYFSVRITRAHTAMELSNIDHAISGLRDLRALGDESATLKEAGTHGERASPPTDHHHAVCASSTVLPPTVAQTLHPLRHLGSSDPPPHPSPAALHLPLDMYVLKADLHRHAGDSYDGDELFGADGHYDLARAALEQAAALAREGGSPSTPEAELARALGEGKVLVAAGKLCQSRNVSSKSSRAEVRLSARVRFGCRLEAAAAAAAGRSVCVVCVCMCPRAQRREYGQTQYRKGPPSPS